MGRIDVVKRMAHVASAFLRWLIALGRRLAARPVDERWNAPDPTPTGRKTEGCGGPVAMSDVPAPHNNFTKNTNNQSTNRASAETPTNSAETPINPNTDTPTDPITLTLSDHEAATANAKAALESIEALKKWFNTHDPRPPLTGPTTPPPPQPFTPTPEIEKKVCVKGETPMNKKPIPKQWSTKVDKTKVHPALIEVITLALDELAAEDVYFKVYSGLRTFAEQDALYSQGRTTPGNIVTKAKGGQSMHNYGLALDLAPYKPGSDSEVYWPEPDRDNALECPWYRLEEHLEKASRYLASKAKGDGIGADGLEFEWGGRWRFKDVPHCQVRTTIGELQSGFYPQCADVDWSVRAHLGFLWGGDWMSRRVQYMLGRLGYSPGAVDGDIGPRSNAAMAQFREREKLPRVGELFTKAAVDRMVRLEHDLAARGGR